MTVSYQYHVTSGASGGFIRLLFRWRGSVWKLVYNELAVLAVVYISLMLLYRYAMTEDQQNIFEELVNCCSKAMSFVPLHFILGFYVTFVADRWWNQYTQIPWPDKIMNVIVMYVSGSDDESRMRRRTLMRYVNLTIVLILRSISPAVKKRFPTDQHLVNIGLMTKDELNRMTDFKQEEFNTYWIPCNWFINLLRTSVEQNKHFDHAGVRLIIDELNEIRTKCRMLWSYDWISVPLVYTQVVTLVTYSYFLAALFGRQPIRTNDASGPLEYSPILALIEYFLYMGLLKVAEQLINPFGDDDEDFEMNWLIDRHIKVSYLGVDTLHGQPPPMQPDPYFKQTTYDLPYTDESKIFKRKGHRGSAANIFVPQDQHVSTLAEIAETSSENSTSSSKQSRSNLLPQEHYKLSFDNSVYM